jgi:hypothetical protein
MRRHMRGGHVVVVVVVSVGRVVQNDRVTSHNIGSLHRLIPSIPRQWIPIQFESSPKAPPLPTSILLLGVCMYVWTLLGGTTHIPPVCVVVCGSAHIHRDGPPHHGSTPTHTHDETDRPPHLMVITTTQNGWLLDYYFCSGGDVCVIVCDPMDDTKTYASL